MVPTDEARITLQRPYSALPPMGIASGRLAMLPPVELRTWTYTLVFRKAGCCKVSCLAQCACLLEREDSSELIAPRVRLSCRKASEGLPAAVCSPRIDVTHFVDD